MAQVIILCFGTWDAAYRNVKYFAEQTLKVLRKFFASISADPIFSHAKFFVLTASAWKERAEEFINNNFPYPTQTKKLAQNCFAAADVSLTIETLKDFPNIFKQDCYSMPISRSYEMTDNYHYIKLEDTKVGTAIVGPVGLAASKVLLEKMCS